MATAVTLRCYTGTNAGTESAAQTGIALMDIDSATNDPTHNQVTPGTNSYEKWLRLKVDTAGGATVSAFWVERTGDLPTGVIVKLGYATAGATPTAATSTVATKTMADGQRYYFDMGSYAADGDTTNFLVLQEQVAVGAPAGAIDTQAFEFGWSAA